MYDEPKVPQQYKKGSKKDQKEPKLYVEYHRGLFVAEEKCLIKAD